MNLVNQLKAENYNKFAKQARGAQIRSRTKWINEGELNPNFFSQLEQKHQTNNIINNLVNENVEIKNDTSAL